MLAFVDSDLYFVQDKNNSINPLLQVGSGSGSVEKSTGSGSGGPKITGSDRIRILILASHHSNLHNIYFSPAKNMPNVFLVCSRENIFCSADLWGMVAQEMSPARFTVKVWPALNAFSSSVNNFRPRSVSGRNAVRGNPMAK